MILIVITKLTALVQPKSCVLVTVLVNASRELI